MRKYVFIFLMFFSLSFAGRVIGGIYPETRIKGYISTHGRSYGSLVFSLRTPLPMIRNTVLRFNIAELGVGAVSFLDFNMFTNADMLYYFSRNRNLGLYGIGSTGLHFSDVNSSTIHASFYLLFGIGAETVVSYNTNLLWELGLYLDSGDSGVVMGIGIKFD